MKLLTPAAATPVARLCNYIEVAAGTVWGPRSISDFELILIVSGHYSYSWEPGRSLTLGHGDVLCIPPAEEHVLRRIDRRSCSIISCIHLELDAAGTWLGKDYDLTPFPPRVTSGCDFALMDSCFRRCRDLFSGYSPHREVLLTCRVKEILLCLAEFWGENRSRALSRRTQQMVDFLRKHLLEGVTRQDLAREFALTPEHVNAVFKRELGVAPTEFVNRERIRRGYELLRDRGLSVKEAAAATGFSDQFYFSRLFRRYLGTPPVRVTWQGLRGSRDSPPD